MIRNNKLCLGTVQFGMKYGINNTLKRQPTKKESFDILNVALKEEINYFDTAAIYGNAEKILGEFELSKKITKLKKSTKIISKLNPYCDDSIESVIKEINASISRLRADFIYGYMLHNALEIRKKNIMHGLFLAKQDGIIQNIGISVYEPKEALEAIENNYIDILQIPYNILDTRWEKAGVFEKANAKNVKIFARSAFLQGLLIMKPETAEKNIIGSAKFIKKIHDISKLYNLLPKELAFLFVITTKEISKLVFGVDTSEQLKENCNILKKIDDFMNYRNEIKKIINTLDVPQQILMPNLWHKNSND